MTVAQLIAALQECRQDETVLIHHVYLEYDVTDVNQTDDRGVWID